jgi:hypothetical protein
LTGAGFGILRRGRGTFSDGTFSDDIFSDGVGVDLLCELPSLSLMLGRGAVGVSGATADLGVEGGATDERAEGVGAVGGGILTGAG